MSRSYAFLFPGQGSQYVKMGVELFEAFPVVQELYRHTEELLGRPISQLIARGPRKELTRTQNLQPAITLVNLSCLSVLHEHGVTPVAVAGHSLGEYAAGYAAGVLDLPGLLSLVNARGTLMEEAATYETGSMIVVNGLDEKKALDVVENACGTLAIASHNAPFQFVISGEAAGVARARRLAAEAGARRIEQLNVSGAWHSPLMAPVLGRFAEVLDGTEMQDARVDVYCNVTAEPERTATALRQRLLAQLVSPVRWSATIRHLAEDLPDATFVEVGPGRVLTGLLLANCRRRRVYNVENLRSLDRFLASMD